MTVGFMFVIAAEKKMLRKMQMRINYSLTKDK